MCHNRFHAVGCFHFVAKVGMPAVSLVPRFGLGFAKNSWPIKHALELAAHYDYAEFAELAFAEALMLDFAAHEPDESAAQPHAADVSAAVDRQAVESAAGL